MEFVEGMSAYKINQAFSINMESVFPHRVSWYTAKLWLESVIISDDKISRVRLTKNSIVDVIRKVESQFKSFNSLELLNSLMVSTTRVAKPSELGQDYKRP